jgi:hypothetical protein
MRASILMLLASLTVLIISISHVHASMVTFQFEGELTSVDSELSNEFSEGDTFKTSYTFDTTSPATRSSPFIDGSIVRIPFASFDNAITAMSFEIRPYSASAVTYTASNGVVRAQFSPPPRYGVFFNQISGHSVEGAPSSMFLSWAPDSSLFGDLFNFDTEEVLLPSNPHFDPNLPIYRSRPLLFFSGGLVDADGNVINTIDLFLENPGQDLFFRQGGGLIDQRNGRLLFSFVNDDQQETSMRGVLTSITVVPIPAAVWLFGTGLMGLIGFTKRKKLS